MEVDVLKASHHSARNGGTAVIDAAGPHRSILAHLETRGVPWCASTSTAARTS